MALIELLAPPTKLHCPKGASEAVSLIGDCFADYTQTSRPPVKRIYVTNWKHPPLRGCFFSRKEK